MKPALVDVAVLILFFNRPEPLKAVFSQVKKARPTKKRERYAWYFSLPGSCEGYRLGM